MSGLQKSRKIKMKKKKIKYYDYRKDGCSNETNNISIGPSFKDFAK